MFPASLRAVVRRSAAKANRGAPPVVASLFWARWPTQSQPSTSASFHASTSHPLPARRRKRGGTKLSPTASATPESTVLTTTNRTLITDPEVFCDHTEELFDELYKALAPMESKNDIFVLQRGQEAGVGPNLTLDLGPIDGMHTIQAVLDKNTIEYSTPLSGFFQYALAKEQHEEKGNVVEFKFRCTADGHELKGMLVRDLIRVAKGCPKL